MRKCSVDSCDRQNHAHDLCAFHLWRRPGAKEKILAQQRERRAREGNKTTKKYEKTKPGFLMRAYRNMLSRVSGVQSQKAHLYAGKDILEKQEFYQFSLNDCSFHYLFQQWEMNEYDRKLTPSIDRIDSTKGYFLENMRWVTHSENSRNALYKRHQIKSRER